MLADDAFGHVVADQLRAVLPSSVEVVFTSASGFDLLDDVLSAERLVVVDTIQTGKSPPGTIHVVNEGDISSAPGESPHYVGLFETLRLGRRLDMPVPREVTIVAVEADDCRTVGGAMTPPVQAAVPKVVALVKELVAGIRAAT